MFTYSEWDKFCRSLLSLHVPTITSNEVLDYENDQADWVLVKHDVEANVKKALQIAKIEAKYGVRATYYVQSYLLDDCHKTLEKIAGLGHEVTYHYDVLDSNAGDMNAAIVEFEETVGKFSDYGFPVNSVCPHGNPMMIRDGWSSNKDFFREKMVAEKFPGILDIVVQLPTLLRGSLLYISDAGYGWKKISNVDDNDLVNKGDVDVPSLSELSGIMKNEKKIIISTHPHRWEKFVIKAYMNKLFFIVARASARFLSRFHLLKVFMSKFYYLAKKI